MASKLFAQRFTSKDSQSEIKAEPTYFTEKIVNSFTGIHLKKYLKGKLLGKGGFGKVYQVTDMDLKKDFAMKVVSKIFLMKKKAEQKVVSEVNIHKTLSHPKIVKFDHVFEDKENVYMVMELCNNKSVKRHLKAQERLSELEAQSLILQLIEGVIYLHNNGIIHRDLKLGNLFLTSDMEVKIGDFGLAVRMNPSDEKRQSICGTPNYIAPEILNKIGYSFEADIWSIGVISYMLLTGKAPFETDDVRSTYKRILKNEFSFPANLSRVARDFISKILILNPARRTTLHDMLAHPFLSTKGEIRTDISTTDSKAATLTTFRSVSHSLEYKVSKLPTLTTSRSVSNSGLKQLLSIKSTQSRSDDKSQSPSETNSGQNSASKANKAPELTKSNFFPKPTISSLQKVTSHQRGLSVDLSKRSNSSTTTTSTIITNSNTSHSVIRRPLKRVGDLTHPLNAQLRSQFVIRKSSSIKSVKTEGDTKSKILNAVETKGISSITVRSTDDSEDGNDTKNLLETVEEEAVTIKEWVDYVKYGLGYLLSNNFLGVSFNDGTKMILNPYLSTFEYVTRDQTKNKNVSVLYSLSGYPEELAKKVTVLEKLKDQLITKKATEGDAETLVSNNRRSDEKVLVYVKKWIKTSEAILLRLNTRILQVMFNDGTGLIINNPKQMITYTNANGKRSEYDVEDVAECKNNDLLKKLHYAQDVLKSVKGGDKDE